jgi:tight adherence protein B
VNAAMATTALAAAATTWLALAPPRRRPDGHIPYAPSRSPGAVRAALPVAATVLGALLAGARGTLLVLLMIGAAAAVAAWALARRGSARRAADRRADGVLEVCEALAGELRAGQPPLVALQHCVDTLPELAQVTRAGELGGDVPAALRLVAALPGAGGLREVADAWQVSQHSGATMSLALTRVAESARERRSVQRVVAAELASAQATARLVATMPVLVLLMGSGIGGDPWHFLLETPAGLACLGLGLGLTFTGLHWVDRIASAAVEP